MKKKNLLRRIITVSFALICMLWMFQDDEITALAAPTVNVGGINDAEVGAVTSSSVSLRALASFTDISPASRFVAALPNIITLVDYKGNINVAYSAEGKLYVDRYSKSFSFIDRISIDLRLPKFGNITCDDDGNYYVVTGKNDLNKANVVVISVSKYGYDGKHKASCDLKSKETGIYSKRSDEFDFGTQYPFEAGNCQIAYNEGILCVDYARKMFNGHQSNAVIYVDADTMIRKEGATGQIYPYMSHSFDQRVLPLSDGGFLLAAQGDAYYRGFGIDKVDVSQNFSFTSGYTFNFREGADRDYGYNETFAQLGGIAELSDSYVLCACSEKTFSSDKTQNTGYYMANEARNLFVQYVKKDFNGKKNWHSDFPLGASEFMVSGETRRLTGNHYARAGERYLQGDEVNYGVIWLTDLDNDHYVANPKIVALSYDNILIMWEERSYDLSIGATITDECASYYAVLDSRGNVVTSRKKMPGVTLAADQDPACENDIVYWTTYDSNGCRINELDLRVADRAVVEAFVKRLYNDCLGREAETEGLKAWSDQLCAYSIDGASIGAGFVFSPEYMEKGTTKTEYVQMLYKVFMGREYDEEGLNYWLKEMKNNGKSREEVLKGFIESAEYTGICEASGIERGTYTVQGIEDPEIKNGIVTESMRAFVERIYNKALSRESDPAGIEFWCKEIANEKRTPIDVAKYFIISPEFEEKGLSDEEYVKILYRTFMGREYDESGFEYWLGEIKTQSRERVLDCFAGCNEFQEIIESFGI